jgi:hypothetical protein
MWTKKNYMKLDEDEKGRQFSFGNMGEDKFGFF